MKHTKQRVVAIDYFRGICILIILLSHSYVFSKPFTYLSGDGYLWASAAEMFFLLSGITLWIVRGGQIKADFKGVLKKCWRRAGILYLIHIVVVFASLALAAALVSGHLFNNVAGLAPTTRGFHLIGQIINLSYSFGWAIFLMYYAVYMLIAPFALYILRTRYWLLVPLLSILVYMANFYINNHSHSFLGLSPGPYSFFASWQVYFFMGLTLTRFRLPILNWFWQLPKRTIQNATALVTYAGAAVLALSVMLGFNLYPVINKLAEEGWVPLKVRGAYYHLLAHKPAIDNLLMNSRIGLLRPLAALLVLAAGYLLYQKHKQTLLSKTGKYINEMGRDTLWIFVAQALAIPLISSLPIRHDLFIINGLITAILIGSMWALTQRRVIANYSKSYINELKTSFYEAKYTYLYRSENDA